MTTRNISRRSGECNPATTPARVKFVGLHGFPRRRKWSAPFVVHVFAIRPMAGRGAR